MYKNNKFLLKMNYITNNNTIIFHSKFNNKLDHNLISNYTKLIFSSYDLNDKLFESYENNCLDDFKIKINYFLYLL